MGVRSTEVLAGWCPFEGRPCKTDDAYFAALTAAVFEARFRPDVVRARWDALRQAFAGFSLRTVSTWNDDAVDALLAAPGIIRNPKKIRATLRNARDLRARVERYGSVARYVDAFRPDLEALVRDLDEWAHYIGAPSIRFFVCCAGIERRWKTLFDWQPAPDPGSS